jgi:S-adenosylmethionine:tRNA ribosyltransferase-isomerase
MKESTYKMLPQYLQAGSLLVMNDTRVVQARLLFHKSTGGVIEIFCLEPGDQYTDITTGMAQVHEVYWKCLVGKAAKWKESTLKIIADGLTLTATIHERVEGAYMIHFHWGTEDSFAAILAKVGAVPLPPYLNRKPMDKDKTSYQTVYARQDGSVAAPTAGLHFTPTLISDIQDKNITITHLTLHVGAGTFLPVKAEYIAQHQMHAEWIELSRDSVIAILNALSQGRTITAVGTTSLRTLESLYWIGIKLLNATDDTDSSLYLRPWECYEINTAKAPKEAIAAILAYMDMHGISTLSARTQILIAPSYTFKIVNQLVTNFHQPNSTLLLLIAAFIGEDWRRVYGYALENQFRFLSYGDGSLLVRGK